MQWFIWVLSQHAQSCSDDGRTDTRLPLLVTAAVDAIHLHRRLALDADMTAAGSVVWTGSSSMDIRMELLQVCTWLRNPLCRPAWPAGSTTIQKAARLTTLVAA